MEQGIVGIYYVEGSFYLVEREDGEDAAIN